MCPPPLCARAAPSGANQGDRLVFGNITLQRLGPFQLGSVSLPGRSFLESSSLRPQAAYPFHGSLFSAYRYFQLSDWLFPSSRGLAKRE